MNDAQILALRGPKASLDPSRAYASAWEEEAGPDGRLIPTAVVFLTNRECPFRCVMCDLWTHTLDTRVAAGAIPRQVRDALGRLPHARQVKLYNAGSYFDPQAIPPEADEEAVGHLRGYDRVIVEAHPAFLAGPYGERALRFRDLLGPARLEIAIGLETAHEPTLARLNKRMTLDSFRRAAEFVVSKGMDLRVFILLAPPFLRGADAEAWACRSIELAAACGATACSVIPTRGGNGAIEALGTEVERPRLQALERVVEYGLRGRKLRVFADTWDLDRFFDCACSPSRAARLRAMNRLQRITAPVPACDCDG